MLHSRYVLVHSALTNWMFNFRSKDKVGLFSGSSLKKIIFTFSRLSLDILNGSSNLCNVLEKETYENPIARQPKDKVKLLAPSPSYFYLWSFFCLRHRHLPPRVESL